MTPTSLVAARRGPAGRLGDVRLAGRIDGGRGVPPGPPRRYPSFALTYVTAGSGRYREAGRDLPLSAGSLVHVFPGRPHWYGVSGPGGWDEVYLVFEGPLFELAARTGVLDPRQPVRTLLPCRTGCTGWTTSAPVARPARPRPAMPRPATSCGCSPRSTGRAGRATELLTAAGARTGSCAPRTCWRPSSTSRCARSASPRPWACRTRPGGDASAERAGCAPARHRLLRRVDAATELLTHTSLSTREIAATLGFSDERHLIRHFRAVTGSTPRAFRDAGR